MLQKYTMAVNRGIRKPNTSFVNFSTQCWAVPVSSVKPLELYDIEDRRISVQLAHESGKVCSPTHRPPFVPRRHPWPSTVLEAESNPGPHCDRKD
jgi:hypothetical protein